MVSTGDKAPEFTAPLANGDIAEFTLSSAYADGPVVLAFFPGAFTGVCTTEMCTFRDRMTAFEAVDAEVYGVSVDTPFSLNEFHEQHDLSFGLVSDVDNEVIEAYGVAMDAGGFDVANRAVFVVDETGTVTYRWVADDPTNEPDYEAVEEAAADAATA